MDGQQPIRVFLVDDQAMIRAGFRSLVSADARFQVVGDSGDPRAAVATIGKLKPDIVLLDVTMPGLSGLDAISLIREVHANVRIVMLTHHEGESFVNHALEAGADGYLSKDSDQAELSIALLAVQRGNPYVSPKVAGGLVRRGSRTTSAPAKSKLDDLTPREREVFQLLALGKSNKEIAKTLSLSLGTAKKHRENLQRKLECHSTAELAILAMREGLLGT